MNDVVHVLRGLAKARGFTITVADEDRVPGGPNRALLDYDCWQTRLGGDRDAE